MTTDSSDLPDVSLGLLNEIGPTSIEIFLSAMGWSRESLRAGVSAIWVRDDASIFVPLDATFRDYRQRLYEALRAISLVHGIRGDALALEIASARSDVVLIRAEQYTRNDTIPLTEAAQLINGAKRMLLAAACSAISPKPNFKGRKPDLAKDFVEEQVRMGHTLRGSFVITIFAPFDDVDEPTLEPSDVEASRRSAPNKAGQHIEPARYAPDEFLRPPGNTILGDDDVPFARRVTSTLATGLHAVNEVLMPTSTVPLGEAVARGASADLIESLAGMTEFEGMHALDLSFKWSRAYVQPMDDIPDRTVLPRARVEAAAYEVSQRLRSRDVSGTLDLVGQVIRLERSEGADNGVVVIDGYVGKVRRRVKTELQGSQYQVAIRAHELRRAVLARGNLTLRGNSYWLDAPSIGMAHP